MREYWQSNEHSAWHLGITLKLAIIFEMMIIGINSYYYSNGSRSSNKTGIIKSY